MLLRLLGVSKPVQVCLVGEPMSDIVSYGDECRDRRIPPKPRPNAANWK